VDFFFSTGVFQFPIPVLEGPSGTIVTDTVDLMGVKNPKQQFLLCDNFTLFSGIEPDGVLGLSLPNDTFLAASVDPFYWSAFFSGQLKSPEFSFYIKPGQEFGSELTLGGVDKTRFQGPITTLPMSNTSTEFGQWIMDQTAVVINGKAVHNSTSGRPFGPQLAILDTGTAFIQTPDLQTAKDLYAAISPQIKPVGNLGSFGARCDVVDRVAVDVILKFGPKGEFAATVPKEFFNLGEFPDHPGMCETIFLAPAFDQGEPPNIWIVGSPLLKNYYTIWNGIDLTMGFAKPIHG
jgi:aspartyl protease